MGASQTTRSTVVSNVPVISLFSDRPVYVTAIRAWDPQSASSTDAFIQLFDAASSADVTLGTTVADWVVKVIGASVSDADGLPVTGSGFAEGLTFAKGLSIAATSFPNGSASLRDTDGTDPYIVVIAHT